MSPTPLNQYSGMPQISGVLDGWKKPITLMKIMQNVVNGIPVDVPQAINFEGTIQPLSPKLLSLKPEGQRGFAWLQIHAVSGSLNLNDNDRIQIPVYDNKIYKVMGVLDYSLNGYIEYHAIEDYQGIV